MQLTAILRSHSWRNEMTRSLANRRLGMTIKVMKLTAVLLLAACMQLAARTEGQTVTLKVKNAPMKEVFREIQKQTGLNVMIDAALLEKAARVTLDVRDMPVPQVLSICLKNEPLTYTIVDGRIVVKQAPAVIAPPTVNTPPLPPPIDVKGRVIDSVGNPLVGASIKVKRTGITTSTNQKGEYELGNLESGDVLIVSYVGYNTIQETVPKNNAFIITGLKVSNNELDKIVIQAYGTTSRRYNPGSIGTVSGETIREQPVMNPMQALQGQVAGLAVNNANTGLPGARVFLQIRGQNSFSKGYDQPLFIIDGIPFARQNNSVSGLANLTQTSNPLPQSSIDQSSGLSPFNNINPNDIESMSILKDADATSIYGSEGSNGVILITTRKGAAGKMTFNTSINTETNSATRPVKLLNTAQYLQLRRDAYAADGLTPSNNPVAATYAPDLTIYDQTKYTNWQDLILGNTTSNTNVNTSLSGGTGNNTFRVSTGYAKSNVNYPGDYSNQRFSINGAFHNISTDKRLEIDFRAMYGYNTNSSSGTIITPNNIMLPPNMPDLKNPDGSLNWVYNGAELQNYQFYATLNTYSKAQNHNFQNSVMISYKLFKGLRISTNAGYNRNSSFENSGLPKTSRVPLSPALSSASFNNSVAQIMNIEPQLDYNTSIGKGKLTALVGGTYKKNVSSSMTVGGTGYTNDGLLESITAAPTKTVTDGFSIRRYAAVFGRVQYIYDGKYIVSLTGRRDGSSNFGPGNQFGNFASVAGAWIFTEENFVQKSIPFLSFGKLSASYGTSGSDGVGQYLFQTFWGPLPGAPAYQGIIPVIPQNHYNPDYSWALKKSLNLSANLGFFKDRILIDVAYYRNRESNQLAASPLPLQTGFSNVTQNVPSTVQNLGWEFGLNTKNIQSKNFTWESSFNLSFNRNKLLSFPNLASSTSYRNSYSIGQPISYIGAFKYAGMDPVTGIPQFYNRSGGITTTPVASSPLSGGDYVANINREADYYGGFGNRLSYKQFRLNFFFQFNSQSAPNWIRSLYTYNRIGISQNNLPAAVLGNFWTKPGEQTELLPLTTTTASNIGKSWQYFTNSDAMYENVTYVRLKTVSFAYNLPQALIKKLHMKSGSINVNAQNLLVFSNVEVGDPESNGNYFAIPIQRIISFGLNFNF